MVEMVIFKELNNNMKPELEKPSAWVPESWLESCSKGD